jgi:hypothetical protein
VANGNDLLIDFGHGLNLARAEQMISVVANQKELPGRTIIDLKNCRHVDAGAAWRVGNALRLLMGSEVTVLVPEGLDTGNRNWFSFFTHSGLGFSIAQFASIIRAGEHDMTTVVRDYYSKPRSYVEIPIDAWASSTYLYIPNLLRGELSPDDSSDFNLRLRPLLATSPFDLRAYSGKALAATFRILFEAVQNTWDHSDKSPWPAGHPVSSSLAIRHFKNIPPPKAVSGEFTTFLRQVEEPSLESEGFIEIVVVDDGVGVAARYSQDKGIYKGPFDAEVNVTAAAFQDGHSVKLSTSDATLRGSPGYGFTKIIDGLRKLNAFTLLRTGRVLFFFDSTLESESFTCLPTPLGYMPGTAIQIIFPRRTARVWRDVDAD